jgi:periplasmic protein TonB
VAFESFRAQERRPARLRRIAFMLVAIFHGVLIAAGVVYSYWHVEELTPPTLRVTFMSMAPPPPPPPPPPAAGGGSRPKKVALKPKTVVPVPEKPPEIVQPPDKKVIKKEFRKHEDEYVEDDNAKAAVGKGVGKGKIDDGDEDGEEDGVAGGVKGGKVGGIIGGSIGGTGTAPAAARSMPPQFGALQKSSGADPAFPPSLRRADRMYVVEAKICIATTGAVESVTLTKRADSLLDENVVSAVKTWRFRPMKFNGTFVPFCYPAKFEFKSQQ